MNFNMLNRFLDLKNLCVATKIMCLAHIHKKILRILSSGGHLGRHLEYFNFPNDTKVASFSFNVRTYWKIHLCKHILCGLFLKLHPKSSFGNRAICNCIILPRYKKWRGIMLYPPKKCVSVRPSVCPSVRP